MRKDFACIVISHGRPECSTVKVLRECGYTGKIYIVVDDEDKTLPDYVERYGADVHVFHKEEDFDTGDLGGSKACGVFARNQCLKVAEKNRLTYYLELDDDVHGFGYRFVQDGRLRCVKCNHLDEVLEGMVQMMKESPITSLSFGLSSYYLGGAENSNVQEGMIRKTMTTFLMRADDLQYFHMRMNDDITTSLINGMRGKLYYTYMPVMVYVDPTQVQHGGMTDIYKKNGTYRKSFYSVMCCPSCVKVSAMGITEYRIHHEISWNNAVPKLLSERWCKHERH